MVLCWNSLGLMKGIPEGSGQIPAPSAVLWLGRHGGALPVPPSRSDIFLLVLPTADTRPERWGIPKRQRGPRGLLPLGGPQDGAAAEELARGVRLHPAPLHRLPPGVGGALQHQGRAGTPHRDPRGCWCRGGMQGACVRVGMGLSIACLVGVPWDEGALGDVL